MLWKLFYVFSRVALFSRGGGPALTAGSDKILIVVAAFAMLTLTMLNPVWLVVGAAVFGLVVY
ncbi:MAG: hypothetical protein NTW38_01855 [Candidatus Aminicenantes bacterium]|nr:hypothetical protein [Candidatus Aminicenantes bacterium]